MLKLLKPDGQLSGSQLDLVPKFIALMRGAKSTSNRALLLLPLAAAKKKADLRKALLDAGLFQVLSTWGLELLAQIKAQEAARAASVSGLDSENRAASRSGHGEEADLVLMIVDTLLKMPYDKASMKSLAPFVKKFRKYKAVEAITNHLTNLMDRWQEQNNRVKAEKAAAEKAAAEKAAAEQAAKEEVERKEKKKRQRVNDALGSALGGSNIVGTAKRPRVAKDYNGTTTSSSSLSSAASPDPGGGGESDGNAAKASVSSTPAQVQIHLPSLASFASARKRSGVRAGKNVRFQQVPREEMWRSSGAAENKAFTAHPAHYLEACTAVFEYTPAKSYSRRSHASTPLAEGLAGMVNAIPWRMSPRNVAVHSVMQSSSAVPAPDEENIFANECRAANKTAPSVRNLRKGTAAAKPQIRLLKLFRASQQVSKVPPATFVFWGVEAMRAGVHLNPVMNASTQGGLPMQSAGAAGAVRANSAPPPTAAAEAAAAVAAAVAGPAPLPPLPKMSDFVLGMLKSNKALLEQLSGAVNDPGRKTFSSNDEILDRLKLLQVIPSYKNMLQSAGSSYGELAKAMTAWLAVHRHSPFAGVPMQYAACIPAAWQQQWHAQQAQPPAQPQYGNSYAAPPPRPPHASQQYRYPPQSQPYNYPPPYHQQYPAQGNQYQRGNNGGRSSGGGESLAGLQAALKQAEQRW